MNYTSPKPLLMRLSIPVLFAWVILFSASADVAPQITADPISQTALEGEAVVLSVTATGTPLYYQWRHGASLLPGETDPTLALNNLTYDKAGSYSVSVSNAAGVVFSAKAIITVASKGVWAWGANDWNQATPPEGLDNIVAAAAGSVQSAVAKRDGTVVAWGLDGYYGYTQVPAGLTDVFMVSCGQYSTAATKRDGTFAVWGLTEVNPFEGSWNWTNMCAVLVGSPGYSLGLHTNGKISVAKDPFVGGPTAPAWLTNVAAIATGDGSYLTLLGDGKVLSWGSQTYVPPWLSNVVAISSGASHNLALRHDGTVVAWGLNQFGQIDVPSGLTNVVAIACGETHSLALLGNGSVIAWGDNRYGQTNVPSYLRTVGAIAAGPRAYHSLAIPAKGPPFITTRLADQAWGPPTRIPDAVFFRIEASGEWPLRYQWQRNGIDLPGATNAFLKLTNVIDQDGFYRVVVANALGSATSAPARLLITAPRSSLAITISTNLTWTTGGSVGWHPQTMQSRDGSAEQSGAITNNQQSWIETTVAGPTPLSFWWRVSSEPGYDFLEFYIDGVLQSGRISGESGWQQQFYNIPTGSHTLRWRYAKDSADKAGQDAGWLDQVLVSGQPTITFTGVPGGVYHVRYSDSILVPIQQWTPLGSPTEISPGIFKVLDPTAASGAQRFYRVVEGN